MSLTTRPSSWSVGISGKMVTEMSSSAPKQVLSRWSLKWNRAWAKAVASCLSQGPDSSLIVAMANKALPSPTTVVNSWLSPALFWRILSPDWSYANKATNAPLPRNFPHSSSKVPRYMVVPMRHSFPKSLLLPSQRPPPYQYGPWCTT